MDRLVLRPSEAAEAIGIGRIKVYELLASGELPSIRIGGSVRTRAESKQQDEKREPGQSMEHGVNAR